MTTSRALAVRSLTVSFDVRPARREGQVVRLRWNRLRVRVPRGARSLASTVATRNAVPLMILPGSGVTGCSVSARHGSVEADCSYRGNAEALPGEHAVVVACLNDGSGPPYWSRTIRAERLDVHGPNPNRMFGG